MHQKLRLFQRFLQNWEHPFFSGTGSEAGAAALQNVASIHVVH